MKKKKKNKALPLVLLFLAAAALICLYIFVIKGSGEEDEPEEPEKQGSSYTDTIKLTEYEASDVKKLTVYQPDDTMTLVKESDGTYTLDGNADYPLNQVKVGYLASKVAKMESSRLLEQNADLANYGLIDPDYKVVAEYSDGRTITFNLGVKVPGEYRYYLSLDDSKDVYIVTSTIFTYFAYTRTELADLTVKINKDGIYALGVTGTEYPEYELFHDKTYANDYTGVKTYSWYFAKPFENRQLAKITELEGFLASFEEFSFEDIIGSGKDKFAEYGLDAPCATLFISYLEDVKTEASGADAQTGASESETDAHPEQEEKLFALSLGGRTEDGAYYAGLAGSDFIYVLSQETANRLFSCDPFALMERFVALVSINSVDTIKIELPSGNVREFRIDSSDEENRRIYENGTEITDENRKNSFSQLFQQIISPNFDGRIPKDAKIDTSKPVAVFEFTRNTDEYPTVTAEYYEYGESFYAVDVRGEMSFYVDKRILDEVLDYIEKW